jgi:hypothetical protein
MSMGIAAIFRGTTPSVDERRMYTYTVGGQNRGGKKNVGAAAGDPTRAEPLLS